MKNWNISIATNYSLVYGKNQSRLSQKQLFKFPSAASKKTQEVFLYKLVRCCHLTLTKLSLQKDVTTTLSVKPLKSLSQMSLSTNWHQSIKGVLSLRTKHTCLIVLEVDFSPLSQRVSALSDQNSLLLPLSLSPPPWFLKEFFKNTVNSILMDTSIRWTPTVGPCLSFLPLFESL